MRLGKWEGPGRDCGHLNQLFTLPLIGFFKRGTQFYKRKNRLGNLNPWENFNIRLNHTLDFSNVKLYFPDILCLNVPVHVQISTRDFQSLLLILRANKFRNRINMFQDTFGKDRNQE